jgi:alpha-L-fucosidase 2
MKTSFAVLSVCMFFGFLTNALAQPPNLKLWYDEPASRWTEALPIGNGRLGAMIFGGIQSDRIQFNEETLWTGGPRDHHREGASKYLPQIRRLLAEGKQDEAEALAGQHFMGKKFNEDNYEKDKQTWLEKVRSDTTPAGFSFDDNGWKKMLLPTSNGWEGKTLQGLDGSVWFRTSFELPQALAGKKLMINLGRIRDLDFTYVNGKRIGSSTRNQNREYVIDAAVLQPGKNVIAVQVINFYDKGGFVGTETKREPFVLYTEGSDLNQNELKLAASWNFWIQDAEVPAFPRYQADYQPFGDVWLQLDHDSVATDYKRELDITKAVTTVSYSVSGVKYTRTYFVSEPHQAIVMNLKADKPGRISLRALLKTPHIISGTQKVDDRTLALSLQVRNGALKGYCQLYATAKNGGVNISADAITVESADEVTFYLTAATNYVNYKDVSGDPEKKSKLPFDKIKNDSYQKILAAHIEEYQRYFNTMLLDLGSTKQADLPTDERIRRYSPEKDPSLITLYLQYGRYLLISSSRPGTRPANLQGIWNDLLTPPWGSKYTTNINAEMNYWPAELLNLSACHEPFFSLIEDVSEAGKLTARAHYNSSGWVLHHNTDLWRGTAPINASNHGIWVTGGAWLCQHLWEHYQFTQDLKFLEQRAYPKMKEAAQFFIDFLVKDPKTGWLISTPSNSPEQGGLVAGPAMDHQLIRELFKNCIDASLLLDRDEPFRKKLQELYKQITPDQIGKHEQLQEWLEDKDAPDNRHRHVSHLWAVYPGTAINWDESKELMNAGRQSLLFRGDGGTGWSLAWKVNLWARFKDGDHTLLMINKLLEPAMSESGHEKGGVYANLFDAHPPFQIDGNFGGAAGISEMLIQSHLGYIELLPALPSLLPSGEIKGVCARGAFDLTISWNDGKLKQVEILSKAGKECTLKYKDKEIRFGTRKGQRYTLDGGLRQIK